MTNREIAIKTKRCPMCEDCPDGCPLENSNDSKNIITNADHIRNLADKELAELLIYPYEKPDYDEDMDGEWVECGVTTLYGISGVASCFYDYGDAIYAAVEWLKQPVEDETK